MLMTAQRARELATLANNELNKLVTIEEAIEEAINKAVDKGKMYICYHSRISNYIKDRLETLGYTTYEQTDLTPDGEFRGYITYIKW